MTEKIVRPGNLEQPEGPPVFVPSLPVFPFPQVRDPEPAPVAEKPVAPAEAKTLEAEKEDLLKQRTPAERWQDALKAAKLDENEALRIIDAVLQKGYWEREYRLWGGKLRVTFRSRDAAHRIRLRYALDGLVDKSDFSVSNALCRANLAASLSSYQGTALPFGVQTRPAGQNAPLTRDEIEDNYGQRLEFIGRLPDAVYDQLLAALAHFDAWTTAAFAEGAAQGF